MTDVTTKVLTEVERTQEQLASLRMQVSNLSTELTHYRDENHNPSWLQSKMIRQAKALTNLNRRVRIQRMILRELNEHHSELAETLFHTVKDKYASELGDNLTLTF